MNLTRSRSASLIFPAATSRSSPPHRPITAIIGSKHLLYRGAVDTLAASARLSRLCCSLGGRPLIDPRGKASVSPGFPFSGVGRGRRSFLCDVARKYSVQHNDCATP